MLAVAGCGGGTTPPPADSGVDTGTPAVDVGPRDGGPDTGVAVDGGQDASAPGDTGTLADSGGGDTGTRDAGRGVPMNHRVDDSECAGAAPPGDCCHCAPYGARQPVLT